MNRRSFIKKAALVSSALPLLSGIGCQPSARKTNTVSALPEKPNFVVVLCDDMGAFELGCYGNILNKTPNLDRLAKEGFRFKTFFATPVCSPTRVCLMTGRYGFRTGWCNMRGRDAGAPPADADLARDEINFAQLLKTRGYQTAIAGKWQLTGQLPTMVFEAGFDEYLMWIYRGDLPKGVKFKGGTYPPDGTKSSRYWKPGVAKNGEHFATADSDYGPDMYCDFLTDFIGRNKDNPFFVYYPMCLIHRPWVPTPDQPDIRQDNSKEAHIANVEYADKIVGRIMDAVEKNGLRDNTVIIFMGDNGTQTFGKGAPTEFGARTPLIVSAPAMIPSGVVSDELVDCSDIYPTLADFSGTPLPADRVYDGQSLKPYLTGKTQKHRDWIFSCLGHYRILRDRHWLLELNTVDDFGKFFYCGDLRDGFGYEEVTLSSRPDVLEAKARFQALLERLPAGKATPQERREFEEFTIRHVEKQYENLPELRGRINI